MRRFFIRIRALEGETLRTLKRHQPFRVDSVSPDAVFVVPFHGNKRRRIDTAKIETIATKGYDRDELRQRVFEEFGPNWNASYIAAIAHEIMKPATS
jgi:hypothetical protein